MVVLQIASESLEWADPGLCSYRPGLKGICFKKPKPQAIQAPYQQQQQQTNTYGTASIGNTPEAKALLDVNLDFGSNFNVDPGVGRRTDLAEQEMRNRWNSAFTGGIPQLLRMQNQESEGRAIRSQGAAEAQSAEYARNQAENQARAQKTMTELERRRLLLPQIVQTGGSSSGSGYNTQILQPQSGGFLNSLIGAAGAVGGGLATSI